MWPPRSLLREPLNREESISGVAAHVLERAQGKRIVFVSGNFNVLHPGHLRLLQFAADCGDFLVVGVNADSDPAITVPAHMRLESVRALSLVDYAFLLDCRPEEFIAALKPAIVVKGKEYESQPIPEREAVASYGGTLLFGSGEVRFSSIDLLRREFFETNLSTIRKPTDFLERHGFNFDQLTSLVESFSKLRVVVVGDLIVDEFIDCDPLGMSREDPTLVVTPIEQARFVGGAGVVAAHAAGFGADVSYFGVIGKDDTAQFASEQLAHEGVKAWFVVDESRPTTLKQRFRAQEKTLLRVSYLRQRSISTELAGVLAAKIESQLDGVDLLIFSDFNYGCLPQGLVDHIIAACQRKGIAMMADSQSSSQIGDISRFKGMQLVTPTETEARIALRDHSSGLVPIAEALCRKARADHVFITLGSEGMLIYGRDGSADGAYVTDQLPAFNSAPKDLAGAGDSLLACASMALVAGGSVWQSAYLGSLAASCQVARLGNSPLTAAELLTELRL